MIMTLMMIILYMYMYNTKITIMMIIIIIIITIIIVIIPSIQIFYIIRAIYMYFQTKSMPHPWGTCKSLKLKYFDDYTLSKCKSECETNAVVQQCGCKDVYMPGKTFTDIQYRYFIHAPVNRSSDSYRSTGCLTAPDSQEK